MAAITVKNSNGNSTTLSMDIKMSLSQARAKLEEKKLMNTQECFIYHDSLVDRNSESEITVEDILKDHEMVIGQFAKLDGSVDLNEFVSLSKDKQLSYYYFHQLSRGLTVNEKGLQRTSKDIMELTKTPVITRNIENQDIKTSYSFSSISQNISLITSYAGSLSIKHRFVDASAEYKEEKQKASSSSAVKEYLLSKYMVHQAEIDIKTDTMKATMDFYHAIEHVVSSDEDDLRKTANLVKTLNNWGYYLPVKFVMGGMLYSCDSKSITSYNETEKDSKNFHAAANAAIFGIRISGDFSFMEDGSKDSESKNEFRNLEVRQIGGKPGSNEDIESFYDSLHDMNNWEIIDVVEFYPSLLLLKDVMINGQKTKVFRQALNLLNEYHYIEALEKLQPYINIYDYATDIECRINVF